MRRWKAKKKGGKRERENLLYNGSYTRASRVLETMGVYFRMPWLARQTGFARRSRDLVTLAVVSRGLSEASHSYFIVWCCEAALGVNILSTIRDRSNGDPSIRRISVLCIAEIGRARFSQPAKIMRSWMNEYRFQDRCDLIGFTRDDTRREQRFKISFFDFHTFNIRTKADHESIVYPCATERSFKLWRIIVEVYILFENNIVNKFISHFIKSIYKIIFLSRFCFIRDTRSLWMFYVFLLIYHENFLN